MNLKTEKRLEKETEILKEILEFGIIRTNIIQNQYNIEYQFDTEDGLKESVRMVDGVFTRLIKHRDLLSIDKPYFELEFYDNDDKDYITYKGNINEIIEQFKDNLSIEFILKDGDIHKLIRSTIKAFKEQGEPYYTKNKYYSLNGYFMHNGKFVDNSPLKELYGNLSESEIKKKLTIAIELLNKYLNFDSRTNTYILFKNTLILPYFWIFKQLKLQEFGKMLNLYGKAKAGKSIGAITALRLYGLKESDVTANASTRASLRNEISTLSTFPIFVDETTNLIKDNKVQELLKQNRFNKEIDITADKGDYSKNNTYYGYKTCIFTQNQTGNIFEGLARGIVVLNYNKKLDNKSKKEFNQKYVKMDLSIIGYVFSKTISKYFKDNSINDYDYSPDKANEFINNVLLEIENKYEVTFDKKLHETHIFDTEDNITIYNVVEEVVKTIANLFYKDKFTKLYSTNELKSFLQNNPVCNIFKPYEYGYYGVPEGKFNKFLLKYGKGNTITIDEYANELDIKIVEGINLKTNDLKDINDQPVFVKAFNNQEVQKSMFGTTSKKQYYLSFPALKRMFNCNVEYYED